MTTNVVSVTCNYDAIGSSFYINDNNWQVEALVFFSLCCKNVITNNIQHKENMKTKDSIVVSTDGLLIGCVHNNF